MEGRAWQIVEEEEGLWEDRDRWRGLADRGHS
jgi:hypothetical protein